MEREGRSENEKQKIARQAKKPKRIKPSKVFVYTLALAALGGGGFLIYDRIRKRKLISENVYDDNTGTVIINNNVPSTSSGSNPVSNSTTKRNDNFPLKRGSRGARVTLLQQSLAQIIGTKEMNANGGIDGQFGQGTVTALKIAGYGEVIDETTFNRITGSTSVPQIVFNPAALALRLYRAAQSKDLSSVLSILKEIRSVSEYSSVNDYYKRQAIISKTIVTDLLNYSFVNNASAKSQIRDEFLRMGLKMDGAGTWSLQGIPLYKDLITLRETIVTDTQNNRIPVRRNTILGDEIKVANGVTWFRSVDNLILTVPTQDTKYT